MTMAGDRQWPIAIAGPKASSLGPASVPCSANEATSALTLQLMETSHGRDPVLYLVAMTSSTLHAVRLHRMDLPDHACPWGGRAMRLLQERHSPLEDHRLTSSEEVEAFKVTHRVATTPQVFAGDERIGGSTDLAMWLGVRPDAAAISYAPLGVVSFAENLIMAAMGAVMLAGRCPALRP